MTKRVVSFKPDENLRNVVEKLTRKRISGAPIIDKDKKVVGVICSSDLAKNLSSELPFMCAPVPSMLGFVYAFVKAKRKWNELMHSLHININTTRIDDMMVTGVVTTPPDASIYEAATLMKLKKVSRLPVVNENDKLIGIITRQDVIRSMID